MIIYGAGMAGLVAAAMLRRFKPRVLEAKSQLPHTHKAVLRFRSEAVSQATGIPFQRHRVKKAIKWRGELHNSSTLDMANAYSYKVTGRLMNRSIGRLEEEDRWIAPANFIDTLAEQCDITFNSPLIELPEKLEEPAISTVPMPLMVNKILALKKVPEFHWNNIFVVRAELAVESSVYQTIYYPGNEWPYYRASLEGCTLIVEMPDNSSNLDSIMINAMLKGVMADFGLLDVEFKTQPDTSLQQFGKILPTDEQWRRNFIFELTQRKNVYSLGRFATWRQILLDDVVKDVAQIERMIAGDSYGRKLAS